MSEVRGFLETIQLVKPGDPFSGFMLEHGCISPFDQNAFAGKRGPAHMCYMNAGRLAIDRADRIYVEGYAVSFGVPLQHAWTIDRDTGMVIDPTLKDPSHISEYFGVAFSTDYLSKTILRTGVWGLLDATSNHEGVSALITGTEIAGWKAEINAYA